MKTLDKKNLTVVCRTCGTDITDYARYNRWTQCRVCYLRDRLERQEPFENLLKRRSEIRSRLDVLPIEIEKPKQVLDAYSNSLKSNASWWRRLTDNWEDQKVKDHWQRLGNLNMELRDLESEHRGGIWGQA